MGDLNLGDRIEIEGIQHEVVAVVRAAEDDESFEVEEGRIPLPGEEGMTTPLQDGRCAWLQPVSVVEGRERLGRLELEMDGLLGRVRETLLMFERDGLDVPVHVAASLVRAACSLGYTFGLEEEPRGALAERVGYMVEET